MRESQPNYLVQNEKWERRLQRERALRKEAERILEEKSSELYTLKVELEENLKKVYSKNKELLGLNMHLRKVQSEVQKNYKKLKAVEQEKENHIQEIEKLYEDLERLVEARTTELHMEQRKIMDSINYARTIQDSFLPDVKDIQANFSDFFLLFLPRDTVSGDFYWFDKSNHQSVLIAADSTGHGVPGAFMSLIGNTLLNQIVKLKGIKEPSEILRELDQGIKQNLKQATSNNRDGMTAGICTIDTYNNIVEYAGSFMNLVHIRGDQMEELKGDRIFLGGTVIKNNRHFHRHFVKAEKGDMFYLFSDGFQDQFGGTKNRKYMVKPLLDFLYDNRTLPMEEQHNALQKEFLAWKGETQQTDDVMVMGWKY